MEIRRLPFIVGALFLLFVPLVETTFVAPLFRHSVSPMVYPSVVLVLEQLWPLPFAVVGVIVGALWRDAFLVSPWFGQTVLPVIAFVMAQRVLGRSLTSHRLPSKIAIALGSYVVFLSTHFLQDQLFHRFGPAATFLSSMGWVSIGGGLVLTGLVSWLVSRRSLSLYY